MAMKGLLGKSLTRAETQEAMRSQTVRRYSKQSLSRATMEFHEVDNSANRWSCNLIFRTQGSVFPRALIVAVPAAVLVIALRFLIERNGWDMPNLGGSQIWTGYNTVLGFLLIFRTQKAYDRWWEGGSLLQQVRGEWYNAASSLIAFSALDVDKASEIRDFQHLMVRLMSLLYCSALQQIAMLEDDRFEILNTDGLDQNSLRYLMNSSNRCEVLISWLQRLVVNGMKSGVLHVPSPVITRVFQEISRGIVNLNNVRKIREFPFPFPYAQMISMMLIIHWIVTPVASCFLVDNIAWAAVLTFINVFAFWCINYIAEEIEMPFGDDPNDLPIAHMQQDMNRSLFTLLQKGSQMPPSFTFVKSTHRMKRVTKAETMVKQDRANEPKQRNSTGGRLSFGAQLSNNSTSDSDGRGSNAEMAYISMGATLSEISEASVESDEEDFQDFIQVLSEVGTSSRSVCKTNTNKSVSMKNKSSLVSVTEVDVDLLDGDSDFLGAAYTEYGSKSQPSRSLVNGVDVDVDGTMHAGTADTGLHHRAVDAARSLHVETRVAHFEDPRGPGNEIVFHERELTNRTVSTTVSSGNSQHKVGSPDSPNQTTF